MIKYNLICDGEHEFEAWFSSSVDYEVQRKKRLISCPHCNSRKVEKAIMAPHISTARGKQESRDKQAKAMAAMGALADKIRADVETNCDYVGEKFSDEARAIHYGEKDARPIYGEATPSEVKELIDEGVAIAPLPAALSPKPKKKLN